MQIWDPMSFIPVWLLFTIHDLKGVEVFLRVHWGRSGHLSFSKQFLAASIQMVDILLLLQWFCMCTLCFRAQQNFQAEPDSYNGAVRENYSWSQDYTDVEIKVFVPKTVVKGRQVNAVRPAASSLSFQWLQYVSHSYSVLRSASVCRAAALKCAWGREPRRKLWWKENSPTRSTPRTPCGAWSPGAAWSWVPTRFNSVCMNKLKTQQLFLIHGACVRLSSCRSASPRRFGGTRCWKGSRRSTSTKSTASAPWQRWTRRSTPSSTDSPSTTTRSCRENRRVTKWWGRDFHTLLILKETPHAL